MLGLLWVLPLLTTENKPGNGTQKKKKKKKKYKKLEFKNQ
jgi:hypothetical protein